LGFIEITCAAIVERIVGIIAFFFSFGSVSTL
jgi:hypothetical protein